MSEQKKIVVTGIHGFVGQHLAERLHSLDFKVHGVGREASAHSRVSDFLDEYSQCNLLDKNSTDNLVLKTASAIIHLAGLASVAESFEKPEQYKKDNQTMTDNILRSAAEQGFTGRAVIISTGAIYDTSTPMPLTEESPTVETSPYSIGKIAAEKTALDHKRNGLDVVVVRPFNHIGPGQGTGFLLPDLYQKIIEATQNNNSSIATGPLDNRRDFTDVRDIVKAYELLATADSLKHDIYNVSSGNSYSGEDILRELKKVLDTNITAVVDDSKRRPQDASEITGSSARLRDELGWEPSILLEETIQDFVNSKRA